MLTTLSFSDCEMVLFFSFFFSFFRDPEKAKFPVSRIILGKKFALSQRKNSTTLPVSVTTSITTKLISLILVKQGSELELKKVTLTFTNFSFMGYTKKCKPMKRERKAQHELNNRTIKLIILAGLICITKHPSVTCKYVPRDLILNNRIEKGHVFVGKLLEQF